MIFQNKLEIVKNSLKTEAHLLLFLSVIKPTVLVSKIALIISTMDTIPKSSIILNWREISTNYLHSLAKSSINHIIAEGKDKMMGGYAFIEDMDLGTRVSPIMQICVLSSYVSREFVI